MPFMLFTPITNMRLYSRSGTLCQRLLPYRSFKTSTSNSKAFRSQKCRSSVLGHRDVPWSRLRSGSIVPRATDTADRSAWKESDGDSPDTRAVKYLLKQGVSRIAALEAYSKASQTAYWTKVTLAENVFSVIEYLNSIGVGDSLPELLVAHPNVLAYNVEDRLKPAIDYLVEIGVQDVAQVIAKRPSLLGLDPENQLRRMVGYFQANDFSEEEIIDMICNNV